MTGRIAALPMYDYPELAAAHDALWAALADRLGAAGLRDVPAGLTRGVGHFDLWPDPRLLLGQGCEYPLARSFADKIRLVASPRYAAPGCDGARYRSAILVRADDPAQTLADLRGRRCAVNEPDSNSGMNLLRAAVAPLAEGGQFFASVTLTGGHRHSVDRVATGAADVAAVDCVSLAHFRRLFPAAVAPLRILAWTPDSPSLPYITAAATDRATLAALRSALADLAADPGLAGIRDSLLLEGFDLAPDGSFAEVLALEAGAAALGYAALR